MREKFKVSMLHRPWKPAPHPVFIARPSLCVECGGLYRQTAAAQNACPGECREKRADRLERAYSERRRMRIRAAAGGME